MKIVNLDGFTTNPGDLSWDAIKKLGDYTVYDRTPADKIVERAKGAEILIVNKTIIDKSTLDALSPELKFIALQSTGYNVVDCGYARSLGISVSNIPSYSTDAVAQLVFSLILQITNKVTLHSDAVRNGEWCNCPDFCFWKSPLTELSGKNIGIIGFGAIGKKVAEIAEAFGMNVLVYSPRPKSTEMFKTAKFVSLNEMLSNSDIITCHCPLTDETTDLINKETISKMKKSAIFINTSRGPVVDEDALADALNNEEIAGAGLDVLRVEPARSDNPLISAKNCYITPHIAWAAQETRERLLNILEENLKAYINDSPQNVVN
ncbi:MAG: D-2-hydroxyacid dehydrogenase [Acetobacter sp.]|nr:D-2-hydroxyacid dehydrogenase [Bacteroides sp.]MCM1340567.1 D-2-hydroxyacid dehydrogenase [Acetobacter sp.]MCM1433307.1 D-2-hydroxyacid dehydrogenase [Clostridiales bacterium]